MIESVILTLDEPTIKALLVAAEDDDQIRTWLGANWSDTPQMGVAMVSATGARLMAESWFHETTLKPLREIGAWMFMDYPDCCDDPLVKGFVNTVLKIYWLAYSR